MVEYYLGNRTYKVAFVIPLKARGFSLPVFKQKL